MATTAGLAALTPSRAGAQAAAPAATETLRLGIAGFTFNKFKLDQTLEMLKKVDVHYL